MNRILFSLIFTVLTAETFSQTLYPTTWTELVKVTVNANNSLTKSVTTRAFVGVVGRQERGSPTMNVRDKS